MKLRLKGALRRQKDRWFPSRDTRDYRSWIRQEVAKRSAEVPARREVGLLTVITPVWDGTPLQFFAELAASLLPQMEQTGSRWFVLSNGCSRPDLLAYLQQLDEHEGVTVGYEGANTGIVKGLRTCLERAEGRYVLPVDADDRLYPDALRLVMEAIHKHEYPPLLYSDEDKVAGSGVYQPYWKPDWDPVLLSNSAYIAHLGVVDRQAALRLGAYTDEAAEGSADWDLFTRFANAGYAAVHIPHILYSWRIHAHSTADDDGAKPYIRSSQEQVMRRFLAGHAHGEDYETQQNLLFGSSAAHFRFVRREPLKDAWVLVNSPMTIPELAEVCAAAASHNNFVALLGPNVQMPEGSSWVEEAISLLTLFPEAWMVGGRLSNRAGLITDAGRHFGFDGVCGCPEVGRHISDPGYFGLMWKYRTVSAGNTDLAVIRPSELQSVLRELPPEATSAQLGCWIGAEALRRGRRVIYSPFLHGIAEASSVLSMSAAEERSFRSRYADLIPDRRFYPLPFSLARPYQLE